MVAHLLAKAFTKHWHQHQDFPQSYHLNPLPSFVSNYIWIFSHISLLTGADIFSLLKNDKQSQMISSNVAPKPNKCFYSEKTFILKQFSIVTPAWISDVTLLTPLYTTVFSHFLVTIHALLVPFQTHFCHDHVSFFKSQ